MSLDEVLIKELHVGPVTIHRELAEAGIPTPASIRLTLETSQELSNGIPETEIERHLAEEGLIEIPSRSRQHRTATQRISVGGGPLSDMIIGERR